MPVPFGRLAATTPKPSAALRGLAGEIAQAAAQTSDPRTRATLAALAPRVARVERTRDELCAEIAEEAQMAGAPRH